jgi:hypothetical protein
MAEARNPAVMHGDEACATNSMSRAERRLSRAVPVYAAPDQDVCSVDM